METQQRQFPITGLEGSSIDLTTAADWTRNHRERHPKSTISQFFGKNILQKILDQPNCMGIRIYYANSDGLNGWQKFILAIANFLINVVADAHGEKHVIITGVSMDGKDQLPPPSGAGATGTAHVQAFQSYTPEGGNNTLGEQAAPCPGSPGCPQNPLTGGLSV